MIWLDGATSSAMDFRPCLFTAVPSFSFYFLLLLFTLPTRKATIRPSLSLAITALVHEAGFGQLNKEGRCWSAFSCTFNYVFMTPMADHGRHRTPKSGGDSVWRELVNIRDPHCDITFVHVITSVPLWQHARFCVRRMCIPLPVGRYLVNHTWCSWLRAVTCGT